MLSRFSQIMTSAPKSLLNMSRAASPALRPIVAVIGTTGSGKSQLAVSLARSLNSSPSLAFSDAIILSADSMQLYKGLDVITNKVTKDEMGGVEHWGLDLVTPGQGGSWELGKWCSEADRKVTSMTLQTLPIICGGTHYFIQHYLFPPSEMSFDRPPTPASDSPSLNHFAQDESIGKDAKFDPLQVRWRPPCPRPPVSDDIEPELLKLLDTFWTAHPIWRGGNKSNESMSFDTNEAGPSVPRLEAINTPRLVPTDPGQLLSLHRLLAAIDPREAGRWDWRDGRKVRRGIERWWERGGSPLRSDEIPEGELNGVLAGRRARFRTLIFWVYEPLESLRPRLDRRVDVMVENGLLREIAELRSLAERIYGSSSAVDHTEGIFQSIGYKEFSSLPLGPEDPDPMLSPLFKPMLERTKLSTQQYAKSQLKWIKKQLLPAVKEARALGGDVSVFVVPGGVDGEVIARDILKSFLSGQTMPDPNSVGHPDASSLLELLATGEERYRLPDTAERQLLNSRKECPICSKPSQPFSVLAREWEEHLVSKTHRRSTLARTREEEGLDRWIAAQKERGEAKKAQRERERCGLAVGTPAV